MFRVFPQDHMRSFPSESLTEDAATGDVYMDRLSDSLSKPAPGVLPGRLGLLDLDIYRIQDARVGLSNLDTGLAWTSKALSRCTGLACCI